MDTTPLSRSRWWSALVVAAVVAVGVWVTGGLISNDHRVAQVLTGGFLLVVALTVAVVARRSRALGLPLMVGFVVASTIIGSWLAVGSTRDVAVDEQVVMASSAAPTPSSAAPTPSLVSATPQTPTATGTTAVQAEALGEKADLAPVLESVGAFRSGAHETTGAVEVVRTGDETVVVLRDLATDPGPDLRLLAVPSGGDVGQAWDLGGLKGNLGTQQYSLPAEVAAQDVGSIVVWCRAFSVEFGTAELV